MERIGVIIVAGGRGRRYGAQRPKQFLLLDGRPVLAHTIDRFAAALPGAEIVVVLPEEHIDFWRNLSARFDVHPHTLAEGGAERFHSVRNGLAALKSDPELIAVQDGVRPLVTTELIRRTAAAAAADGAAIPVVAIADSVRAIDDDGSHIVDRNRLRSVQTPQIFRAGILRDAYAADYRPTFTDDASVVEAAGYPIRLCEGEIANRKITERADLIIAEALLAARKAEAGPCKEEPDTKLPTGRSEDACRHPASAASPDEGAEPVYDPGKPQGCSGWTL